MASVPARVTARRIARALVLVSLGWHARSVLQWAIEQSGERTGQTPTVANLPGFRITIGRLHP